MVTIPSLNSFLMYTLNIKRKINFSKIHWLFFKQIKTLPAPLVIDVLGSKKISHFYIFKFDSYPCVLFFQTFNVQFLAHQLKFVNTFLIHCLLFCLLFLRLLTYPEPCPIRSLERLDDEIARIGGESNVNIKKTSWIVWNGGRV